MIVDHYGARRSMMQTDSGDGIYRPAPPDGLYLDKAEWGALLVGRAVVELSPRQPAGKDEFDAGGRPAPDFSVARADPKANVFTAVAEDRKSGVKGKSVSVSVDLGGRRIINKKKKQQQ